MPEQKWVVEYSVEQDAFHIETLDKVLKMNAEDCFKGTKGNDYKPLAIADSQSQAQEILVKFEKAKGILSPSDDGIEEYEEDTAAHLEERRDRIDRIYAEGGVFDIGTGTFSKRGKTFDLDGND